MSKEKTGKTLFRRIRFSEPFKAFYWFCYRLWNKTNPIRATKRTYFRIRHGFWPQDWWNFDSRCAKWVYPRLKFYSEHRNGYPGDVRNEEWDEIVKKIVWSMEFIATEKLWPPEGDYDPSPEDFMKDMEKVQEGLDLFGKWFMAFWD